MKSKRALREVDKTEEPETLTRIDVLPKVRITVDGRLALTVEQAALRHGMAPSSMSALITRERVEAVAMLDGKKRLYAAAALDEVVRARPGRGAHLRKESRS